MIDVDATLLHPIAPRVRGKKGQHQTAIIAAVGECCTASLDKYAINTRLRVAHFLAQVCHESDGFCTTTEYASGEEYEGRKDLGNVKRGDGRRYKGRGLIQLTGRANYKKYGDVLGINLVDDPEKAAEPATSLLIACEYWNEHKLSEFADRDDIVTITRRINGGLNGIESRRAYLAKAKRALSRVEAAGITGSDPAAPAALHRGSEGDAVTALQTKLRAAGYPVTIDGEYGGATELAVKHFQAKNNLAADGIAGPDTLSALDKAAT
jgi:putative chitinase